MSGRGKPEPEMAAPRFLIVRLGSLGDIVHTLPAVHALHEAHPDARIDWIVESRWRPLLEGNPDITEVLAFDKATWQGWRTAIARLRANLYTSSIDFQGLWKSALLARFSGAEKRFGFAGEYAREGGASVLYTLRVRPEGKHVIEHNLSLVAAADAGKKRLADAQFPLRISPEAEAAVQKQLAAQGIEEYFVLCPGGGWVSKCWPAERYGHLHRRIVMQPEFSGLRGVVNFGPGEKKLAEAVRLVADQPEPILLSLELSQLMALIRRAKFLVGGDTGPLHLAAAMGVPVVALFGPTDPARNGPFNPADIVIRNARPEETTYKRHTAPAPSMLTITVEQVLEAVHRRMGALP
jgi:lipopolysaccharide heptosyltransferase I